MSARHRSPFVTATLAVAVALVGVVALAVPAALASARDAYAARNGIGYVNLHERIPDDHVRVIVPQLLARGWGVARANHVLRRDAANVTAGWRRLSVPALKGIHRAFPRGHVPAGDFSILPAPSLVASSPMLVDAILPVSSNFPNGVNNMWWAHAAALLPSGDAIDLSAALFVHPSRALQHLARVMRRELARRSHAADICSYNPARGAAPLPTAGDLVEGLVQAHAIALLTGGLELGINQGVLGSDACGLSRFLLPYATVLPFVTPLGRELIDSFLDEPSPWDRGGLAPAAFPAPIAEALHYVASRTHFPAEGPTQTFSPGLTPSVSVTATPGSYSVAYFPCRPALPMNSPHLDGCITSNVDIWGGFGGTGYRSHAAAVRAMYDCSPDTCEGGAARCPARSRHGVVDGQRVAVCGSNPGRVPQRVSWERGTWTFIVYPPYDEGWRSWTAEIVQEARTLVLSHDTAVLQFAAGGDHDATTIEWTVGKVDYEVDEYFGGGLSAALSFRPIRG